MNKGLSTSFSIKKRSYFKEYNDESENGIF